MEIDPKNLNLTPMMEQFFRLKKENPEFIIFFRMGDFYEMFDEDARQASQILGVVLTKRQQFDMCGIPHHARDNYLYKLIQANYKVAICDQIEIVQNNKKTFDRKVVELITPGTFHQESILQKEKNHFLMCLYTYKDLYYFCFADVSDGKLLVGISPSVDSILSQIYKYNPSEILVDPLQKELLSSFIGDHYSSIWNKPASASNDEEFLKQHFRLQSLTSLGLEDPKLQFIISITLQYLQNNLFKPIKHMNTIERVYHDDTLYMNETTIKNLEVLEAIGDNDKKKYSLWAHLNQTKTSMGARHLRQLMVNPSTNIKIIEARLSQVEYFTQHNSALNNIRHCFYSLPDLERLLAKISLKTISPKEVWVFKNGLNMLHYIQNDLPEGLKKSFIQQNLELQKIIQTIETTLVENPPIEIGEEPVILDSYSDELYTLRQKALQSYNIILEIEKTEQENNNIPRLRIKYNKMLGYYIEIPKGEAVKVPSYFIRKQSLSNLERFTIEKLIHFEQEVLTAKDNLIQQEKEIFNHLCLYILESIQAIQNYIKLLKDVDVYTTFAQISVDYNYVKPIMGIQNHLHILEGRHPVVEKYAPLFTSNSLELNDTDNRLWMISGPNMAGKSTFLRQSALIILMAHMGCFVPASKAIIPITDQIFTRIGASDNLAKGESTFLVEMAEASSILNFATPKSFIIMDEIGRGTSTYDGLCLAQAILEYLCDPKIVRGKILFATHYHELSNLEQEYEGIKNYHMAVKEDNNHIVFLHKIQTGSANKSYGIHVASIAGIPQSIIQRATLLLNQINNHKQHPSASKVETMSIIAQEKPITDYIPAIKEIQELDINKITGLDALNLLHKIKKDLTVQAKKKPVKDSSILF